jgi:hypothetical protein
LRDFGRRHLTRQRNGNAWRKFVFFRAAVVINGAQMKIRHFFACVFVAVSAIAASNATAAIVNNGDGTFKDTATGYDWMDLDTFYGDTYGEDSALILPDYTFATEAQTDQLEADTGLTTSTPDATFISVAAAMGVPTPTPIGREIIWGIFGDGTEWAYIYGPENPVGFGWTDADAYVDGYGDEGAFVVDTAPGVPEPAAWAMMLLGIGGIGATMRHARGKACVDVAPVA